MLVGSNRVLPANVKRLAVLDADAEQSLRKILRDGQEPLATMYRGVIGDAHFLPCAPELGLATHIETNVVTTTAIAREYSRLFPGHIVNVAGYVASREYQNITNANPRKQGKLRMNFLMEKVAAEVGLDEVHVRRVFYGKLAESMCPMPFDSLRAFLGPIFNVR